MLIPIILTAGDPVHQAFHGKFITIADMGTAGQVEMKPYTRGPSSAESVGFIQKGSTYESATPFDGAYFTAAVGGTIQITVGDVKSDVLGGTNIVATVDAAQLPLPVADQSAATITGHAPINVAGANTLLIAAAAKRNSIRFLNQGPDPVALGSAALTWPNRVIVLNVNEAWIETDAPAVAWYAVNAAATNSAVTVQETTR